jgi:hypothetical protein
MRIEEYINHTLSPEPINRLARSSNGVEILLKTTAVAVVAGLVAAHASVPLAIFVVLPVTFWLALSYFTYPDFVGDAASSVKDGLNDGVSKVKKFAKGIR